MFAWRDQYLSYNGPSGPTTDPYWTYVSLLENFETPQQTYVDSSTNNLSITPVGNTRPSLFTPFSDPSGSMYFDGNGDYGNIPDNSVFQLTGDFTMEAWVYLSVAGTRRSILTHWPGVVAANCAFAFEVFSNNQIYFSYGIGGSTGFKNSTSTVASGQWIHVAVARQGTNFRFFIGGVLINTTTLSGSLNNGTGDIRIGSMPTEGNFMNGFISNLRLVNGTALYTATFTPSTTPLTAVTNTALLVNATNQGYPTNSLISDQAKNAFTVTPTNSPAFSGLSPFTNTYPGSINFKSASSQYLTVATNAAFTYGTGDFTIECWVRFSTVGSVQYIIDQRNSGTATAIIPTLYVDASNFLTYYVNGAARITGATAVTTNTWYHVAVARTSTSTKMFLNGVQEGSTYSDSNNYAASRVIVGSAANSVGSYLNGYVSNVRLSKGFCYYTTAFTPSTTPLPISSTYTSLFISGNLAGGYDLSTQGQVITTSTSNSVISTQQKKFGTQSISYTATGYQTVFNSTSLQFGTGDYTVEGWIYRNASGATHSIICKGGGTTGWLLQVNSSNQLVWTSGTTALKTSTTTIAATTWTYFAITRSGTTGYMFINGTLEGSSFTDSANYNQTDNMLIGADRSSANGLNGYLDDIRVTTGICRYTSTFGAPSTSFPTS